MSDSNTLLRFGRPARRHQRIYCNFFVIEDRFELSTSDSNAEMLPLHYSIIFIAVRMRIELIVSDRQSEMLAITPTNQYSGVLFEAVLHTIVFRACSLYRIRTGILK